jgi:hypothetical protein
VNQQGRREIRRHGRKTIMHDISNLFASISMNVDQFSRFHQCDPSQLHSQSEVKITPRFPIKRQD